MGFKFSVVIAAHNSENYLSAAIDSIVNQSLDFKRNIQIIIIDDGSDDYTPSIAQYYQDKFPDNILFLRNDGNYGPGYSRNRGLGHAQGEFINFLDSDDHITQYAFSQALSMFKKHKEVDIVSMPIHYFGSKHGEHPLNYKFYKTQVIDLMENPEYPQLSGASSFFRFSKLKDYKFDETLRVSEDPLLINQMLLDNPHLGLLDGSAYFYRKHDDSKSLIGSSSNRKSFYTTRIDNYFLKLIDCSLKKYGEVPKFIQHVLMYDLQWVFEIRKVNHLLSRDEFVELYAKLIKILSFIDNDIILFQKSIPGHLKAHILLLKNHSTKYLADKTDIPDKGCTHIHDLELDKVYIDICQVENRNLYILGYFTTFTDDPDIRVNVDGELMKVNLLSFPQRDNYSLNYNYGFNHHFDIRIPLGDGSEISFETEKHELIPEYNWASRLSETSHYILSKKIGRAHV